MRMDLEMKNTSNSDCTHCTIVVSLEMSDEPKIVSFSLFLTNDRFLEAKRGENGQFSCFGGDLHGGVGGTHFYITRARMGDGGLG